MHETSPLLEGSVARQTLRLAIPVLIAMSFQTVYSLANLFFVGKLGPAAVAALSISLNAFFVILTFGHSLGTGALALISQAWGRREYEKAREIFTQVLWLTLILGLVLWLIFHFISEFYISSFTLDSETISLGVAYFKIYSATFFFQLFLMVMSFCFRGSGDFKTPMYIMLVSVVLNVVLDPLLIYGLWFFPKLGVRGAAIASIFSQTVSSLALASLILGKRLNLYITAAWKPNLQTIRALLKIGLPSGVQYLILSTLIMITYSWIKPLGPSTAAAVGIGFRLLHTSYLPMVSFSIATATLVGQNWGAGNFGRVRESFRWGLIYTNGWAFFITTLYLLFPALFIGVFSKDPAVLDNGVFYMRVFGWSNFMAASIFIITAVFQGLGRTVIPLIGAAIKVALYGVIWWFAHHSQNLYLIYGSSVFCVIFELIWDVILVRKTMAPTVAA